MRRFAILSLCLLSAALTVPSASAQGIDREARVRFNASLPPNCVQGWNGRGIGLVAICQLANRAQVRFIDGRVTPCARPDCADRAPEVDAYLTAQGF